MIDIAAALRTGVHGAIISLGYILTASGIILFLGVICSLIGTFIARVTEDREGDRKP